METTTGAEFISPAHVRHIMRYVKAIEFLKPGMKVIDGACGTGYGTALIAKTCDVLGLDIDREALTQAGKDYPNCRFAYGDLTQLAAKYAVDAWVGIETIEHFSSEMITYFLENVNRSIVPGGLFIVSTPYCRESGPSPVTKQHLWEFSLTDLEISLNNNGFKVQEIHLERHEGKAGRLGYVMVKCSKNSRY